MAKITNPSQRPLRLLTGHVVPANGALDTTNEILRSPDNWPMLNGLALSGQISLQFDEEIDATGIATEVPRVEPLPEALAQAEIDRQLAIAAEETAAAAAKADAAEAPALKKK